MLRALIVEDVERDADLLVRELKRGGFDVTFDRVDTAEAMSLALDRQRWDIVISDYTMPRFSAPAALALVNDRKLDLPFIIVSGTIGEETAVKAMRAGAHDFMVKGEYARLIPAVEREIREAALRAERAKMQEQLLISERMASVGTLAAGVAHEINNPLAALIANLAFAADEIAKLRGEARSSGCSQPQCEGSIVGIARSLEEVEDPLRDARESADRIREIVRDLKTFSRSADERPGVADVRRIIESTLRMAWNEIRHRARLVKDYADLPPVQGDEGRLGQVFLNLIINAAQAIPEGRADENEIRIVTRPTGDGRVVIEVRDTGAGIPEADLTRIFDPFFTTKPIGVGTGLGLAICHRIVAAAGGRIDVDSRVGGGTTFRVHLPVASEGFVSAPASRPRAAPLRRGKVLVVDDEPALCTAIRRMLASDHDVVVTASGREALQRVSGGERFDAILCDLMMPEVTGMDLHAELSLVAPGQAERMIFMTGGTFTSRARDFLDEVPNPRVEKPFDRGMLRFLIGESLR
ncbi:MAG: response regulator [Deltaproteobacteria bacterium]|nr:response regulator [Deltaproteobacteria bacterium]